MNYACGYGVVLVTLLSKGIGLIDGAQMNIHRRPRSYDIYNLRSGDRKTRRSYCYHYKNLISAVLMRVVFVRVHTPSYA